MADDNTPKSGLPDGVRPIDWLAPQTSRHAFVLQYLLDRLNFSERKMQNFYPRWRSNEYMLQAYISMKDFAELERATEMSGQAPNIDDSPVAINVPFAWATVNTIVTYLLHMFAGRRPIFQVGSYRAEQVTRARSMEMFLQYNADVVKFVRALYFFLMDGETYGVAIMRTLWKQEIKQRSVLVPPTPDEQMIASTIGAQAQGRRQPQEYISFEGSSCANIDPFAFFPDPRVPMHEVNEKGEWVFWRAWMGKHQLLTEEAAGRLKWVRSVDANEGARNDIADSQSVRGVRALGGVPGETVFEKNSNVAPNFQVDQGTIDIVPKDLGLGDSSVPEKWMFTVLNKKQIIQAQPVDLPAGKHPVHVAEPNSVGYSFGQLGTVDMLGPMQQVMSWFMNSHIHNVRAALNNMFVVDPTKVEMQDLRSPRPGKIIRLKNTAFGLSDPKNAVQQLAVTDITRAHLADFGLFQRLASDMTGATDNVRGLQDAGGRKTATEIRTSAEAGTSRLAAKGKVYSAMAFTGLAETWALNAQANLSQEFELSVLGAQDPKASIRITNDALQGDFVFPVHDGTLPVDKLAMLEVWKEIYMGIASDPQLRSNYDMLEMFDWIAQLGGAQNIKSFRISMVPQTQQMNAIGSGQGIPLDAAMAALGGRG